MNYRISLAAHARADLERHYDWHADRDRERAERWYESFWAAVPRLQANPLTCGLAFESGSFPEELRHLLFGQKARKYRALFVVRGDEVVVIAVRGPDERPIAPGDFEEPY